MLHQTAAIAAYAVLKVGDQGTVNRSIAAAVLNRSNAIIGGISGFGEEVNPASLLTGTKRMVGIFVGSRFMLEQVIRVVKIASIHPMMNRTFFSELKEAHRYMTAAAHFR